LLISLGSAYSQIVSAGGDRICKNAAQRTVLTLKCPPAQVMSSINFASYGAPNGTCKTGLSITPSCHSSISQTILTNLCLGLNSCVVNATNTNFGNACMQLSKKLSVIATCTSTTTLRPCGAQGCTASNGCQLPVCVQQLCFERPRSDGVICNTTARLAGVCVSGQCKANNPAPSALVVKPTDTSRTSPCAVVAQFGKLNLNCPSGQVVTGVVFVDYGSPRGNCATGLSINRTCTSSVPQIVNSFCLGKNSCQLNVTNKVWGNPCEGVDKVLALQVTCGAPTHEIVCVTAAQDTTFTLTCPSANQVIVQIIFGSYGTPFGACPTGWIPSSCNSNTTMNLLSANCIGKNSCSMDVSNTVFGNPCLNVPKGLVAQMACGIVDPVSGASVPVRGASAPLVHSAGFDPLAPILASNPHDCNLADDGSHLILKCPMDKVILQVTFASYGLPTGNCGDGFVKGTCDATNSLEVVTNLCLGKARCSVQVQESTFAPACVGEPKVLAASILCGKTPQ